MLVTRAMPAGIDMLALHRRAPLRYPMLLESSSTALGTGSANGRWDMLLAANGESLAWQPGDEVRDARGAAVGPDFLDALDAAWTAQRIAREEPRWPFRGGWALFLPYELAAQIEPVLRLPIAETAPQASALRCPAGIVRDHATGECVALAEAGHEAMLDRIFADAHANEGQCVPQPWQTPTGLYEDDPNRYLAGVARILQYLVAGDVFQVNLSRAWEAEFAEVVDPSVLYDRLRRANPAPFAGLFATPPVSVVSSSPERLLSIRGDLIETRPIAGTRPRFDGDDDALRIRELVGHPKERAEHVMLIDLERNDLGRVCAPGSVEVDELMSVESYAHVHHIVSNVRGRLRADASPGDAVRAVFPGGTITGCPKVRCMQIIAELECTGRGAYTGAMGWLNRDGDLDLNILIRSAQVHGNRVRFRTGAGIVADSDPQRELEETRAKARGMLKALGTEA